MPLTAEERIAQLEAAIHEHHLPMLRFENLRGTRCPYCGEMRN